MDIINKSLSFFIGLIYLPLLMAEPLPDPLVLEQAMGMADDAQHYQIIEAQASIVEARSELERAEANLGFRAQLEVEAAYIDPSPIAFDQTSNDSHVSLRLIKPLYDFGSSTKNILAAQTEQMALQNHMPFIIGKEKLI